MRKSDEIKASMQLEYLPLTMSGPVLGLLLAISDFKVSLFSSAFLLLCALCVHTLSRYRLGIVASVVSALLMIKFSFGTLLSLDAFCIMLLVAAAIVSSRKYSYPNASISGKKMTVLASSVLLGPVAVLVPYFISAHTVSSWYMLLPAMSVGFLCAAATNIRSKIPHSCFVVIGWICMIAFCCVRFFDLWHFLFVASCPLFVLHLCRVWKNGETNLLRPYAWHTLAFALLAGFGYIRFLL